MSPKLQIEAVVFKIIGGYTPQVELQEETFLRGLHEVMQTVPGGETGDKCRLPGHVCADRDDVEEGMGKSGIQGRWTDGFAKRFERL